MMKAEAQYYSQTLPIEIRDREINQLSWKFIV